MLQCFTSIVCYYKTHMPRDKDCSGWTSWKIAQSHVTISSSFTPAVCNWIKLALLPKMGTFLCMKCKLYLSQQKQKHVFVAAHEVKNKKQNLSTVFRKAKLNATHSSSDSSKVQWKTTTKKTLLHNFITSLTVHSAFLQ